MIRRGFGEVALCVATLALASCSSSTAPGDNEQFTLTGSWAGAVGGGSARLYSVTFNDSASDLLSTSFAGQYILSGDQDGIGFAQARIPRNSRSVVINFDTTPFRGSFAEADTVVGEITIASRDYPLTLRRSRSNMPRLHGDERPGLRHLTGIACSIACARRVGWMLALPMRYSTS